MTMETLLTYLIKSGGLLAGFFLFYYLLLRRETFFNLNRWFLLSGLVIATLLPLYTIEREIIVEQHVGAPVYTASLPESASATNETPPTLALSAPAAVEETPPIDWSRWLLNGYMAVCGVLLLHVMGNLFSLYRLLRRRPVVRTDEYALVEINDDIAPFSFFRYIVMNPTLYNEQEFESILSHEKVHSRERHSFDVLFVRLFCIVFWFNPFVWLYRKAVAQNLEYIADRRAVAQVSDRRAYQLALLRVAANPHCLSLTNPFYQSLIKKRIVMLNSSESNRKNLWKYALLAPLIAAFVLCFQIEVIAREAAFTCTASATGEPVTVVIDKNTTDAQIKEETARLKKEHGVTLKVSKVKRNKKGEITGIKVEYKDKDGRKGISQVQGDEPIAPIRFHKGDDGIGFGGRKAKGFFHGNDARVIRIEAPEAPEAPQAPNADGSTPEPPQPPQPPAAFSKSFSYSFGDEGDEPIIVVNGKRIDIADLKDLDVEFLKGIRVLKGDNITFTDTDGVAFIDGKGIIDITTDALEEARIQIEQARPQLERAKKELAESRMMKGEQRYELDKAKAEMDKAREEMQKARAEMEKAKAELEKARAELRKKA